MKKILVPEGMVEAVQHDCSHALDDYTLRRQLGVALLWLSDNPIAPTDEQVVAVCKLWDNRPSTRPEDSNYTRFVSMELQKIIFLVPEQEEIEYDLDPEKARFRVALEKLAKLGNGDAYGNSRGNEIAQEALGMDKRSPTPVAEMEVTGKSENCTHDWRKIGIWTDQMYRCNPLMKCSKCDVELYRGRE